MKIKGAQLQKRSARIRVMLLYSLLLFSAITVPVYGQEVQTENADATLPAYDVLSIKPNTSGSGNTGIDSNLDTFKAVNVSLAALIESAYGIKKDLIAGMPKPLNTARFDMSAKITDLGIAALKQLSPAQYRAMLKPLLIERFHLKMHTEVKQLPVYDLIVVRGGPKFKESPKGFAEGSGTHSDNRELTATAVSMSVLEDFLYNQVHRTVIDTTGFKGKYDMTLKWSPEDSPDTAGDTASPIFTALTEQLGLKLIPAKGPVETLVVDHAQIPTPD